MVTTFLHTGVREQDHCPVTLRSDEGNHPATVSPRLMRVSEIDRECAATSTPSKVVKWLREFLAQPHPDLGRSGAVCPFVPIALEMDSIWIAEIATEDPSADSIASIITEFREIFLKTDPTHGPEALSKAFLVAFPTLTSFGSKGAALVDEVQYRLKRSFVEKGIMLGEFHATNNSPGLRNPDFRPLRSPIPLLAVRHMVESDLPFMTRANYSANEQAAFLRAYLFRLGGSLKQASFDEALERLIAVEGPHLGDEAKDAEERESKCPMHMHG